jgi:hypothetical protein
MKGMTEKSNQGMRFSKGAKINVSQSEFDEFIRVDLEEPSGSGGGDDGDDGDDEDNRKRNEDKIKEQQNKDRIAYGGRAPDCIYESMVGLKYFVEEAPQITFFGRIKRGICHFAQGISNCF